MTLLHVVLCFVIELKWTSNFICLYTNRKGFQCIWSLFMTKNTNTLAPFSDCVNMYVTDEMKCNGIEGIKKLFLWIWNIWLWIIVYVLGRWLVLSHKNNEDAIFISNNQLLEVMQKAARVIIEKSHRFREWFFNPKHNSQNVWIQFNVNDFLQEIAKISHMCYRYFDTPASLDDWKGLELMFW